MKKPIRTYQAREAMLHLRLHNNERNRLIEIARERGISLSEAARSALRELIKTKRVRVEREQQLNDQG